MLRDGELIEKRLAPPLHPTHGQGPMLIRDGMDHTWNPVNGKHYDSKSEYYKAVRAAGGEIVGNERLTASPRPALPDPVHDIKQAIEQAESRAPTVRRKRRK